MSELRLSSIEQGLSMDQVIALTEVEKRYELKQAELDLKRKLVSAVDKVPAFLKAQYERPMIPNERSELCRQLRLQWAGHCLRFVLLAIRS